jgi:hypothetical protein
LFYLLPNHILEITFLIFDMKQTSLFKEEKQLILKIFQKEALDKRFDYVSLLVILFLLISLSTFFIPTDVHLSFLILDRIQQAFLF